MQYQWCTFLFIQVIAYLTQTIDLCDTPLNDILNFVQTHEIFKGVDI